MNLLYFFFLFSFLLFIIVYFFGLLLWFYADLFLCIELSTVKHGAKVDDFDLIGPK